MTLRRRLSPPGPNFYIRAFQIHLVGTGISWPALNQTECALRFIYGVTLGHAGIPERTAYARSPRTLPVVLGADEVALELLGVGEALMLDQRQLGEPHTALAQVPRHLPGQRLARPVEKFGVGLEHRVLGLHGGVGPRTDPEITWRVSTGCIAPVLIATLRLSCRSAVICSSPSR